MIAKNRSINHRLIFQQDWGGHFCLFSLRYRKINDHAQRTCYEESPLKGLESTFTF